ncbi:MAG: lipopolysaccharide transport periplasmic protein LptA [Gammaproteobacteria bacterium]|nr:MAG: lipopolysaccharide transport periplasmic protein LptA [Gammaproteobacteria bacterium]
MPRLNNMARFAQTLCIGVAMLLTTGVAAKTSDNDQPLHIEADSVEIREQQGVSIYRGNVSIQRGTMQIHGELIHIYSRQGVLEKIRVEGSPAKFRQLNDLDEEISAQCRQMEYQANNGTLILNQEAILVQNRNQFSSEQIIYDTRKDIVQAGNQTTPDASEQPQRVTITIHPEKTNSTPEKQEQ